MKRATGRDVAIDGPIRPLLLPTPGVELDGVKFPNLTGSKTPSIVEVESVTVRPSLLALLAGDVALAEVALVELFGSTATGAVSGFIDLTLGNVTSVLGDKGGVGGGNLLNAISLVLNRFVNHDNALSATSRSRAGC